MSVAYSFDTFNRNKNNTLRQKKNKTNISKDSQTDEHVYHYYCSREQPFHEVVLIFRITFSLVGCPSLYLLYRWNCVQSYISIREISIYREAFLLFRNAVQGREQSATCVIGARVCFLEAIGEERGSRPRDFATMADFRMLGYLNLSCCGIALSWWIDSYVYIYIYVPGLLTSITNRSLCLRLKAAFARQTIQRAFVA